MLARSRTKRVRRTEGSVVKIALGGNKIAYGLVLREPLVAIFDRLFAEGDDVQPSELLRIPIAFILMVMNSAVTSGGWPVVGHVCIPDELRQPPAFCKQDPIDGKLSIYQELGDLAPSYERPATLEECEGLEAAAVWGPGHVEDLLRDHFAGRPNIWAKSLRIRPEDIPES
jgi:hypothetical protein